MIIWLYDYMISWLFDDKILWLYAYMIIWFYDYMIIWLYDYIIILFNSTLKADLGTLYENYDTIYEYYKNNITYDNTLMAPPYPQLTPPIIPSASLPLRTALREPGAAKTKKSARM